MIKNLYYRIQFYLENFYFKRKYAMLQPQIYYDAKHSCYINPLRIGEAGCCEYVCCETAKTGLIYHFYLSDKREHCHIISEVLIEAYNQANCFSIAAADRNEYSKQELLFIQTLVECGKRDLSNWEKTL